MTDTSTVLVAPLPVVQPSEPTFTIEDVGPELAAEWLVHNTHNRNVKTAAVARFAADMTTGDWRFNGEPIRFAVDGTLIDGQNRLHAVVQSGCTVRMLVGRNFPLDVQEITDIGTSRKLSDVLKLRGEVQSGYLAAVLRLVHEWEAGRRRGVATRSYGSVPAYIKTLDEHPRIRDFVQPARAVGLACGLPGSIAGLCWWLFDAIDSEDAAFFMARLRDGQGLVKGDPIYELRRTLGEKSSQRTFDRTFLLVITIKAWNAYRAGETVGLYRWRPGGAKPEQFPEPI